MGQTYIQIYPNQPVSDKRLLASKVLESLKATSISVTKFADVDTSWENRNSDDFGPVEESYVYEKNIEEALNFYEDQKFIIFRFHSSLSDALTQEVYNKIGEPIRDDHMPHNAELHLNEHDIFEDAEKWDGHLFARTNFSVLFYGDSVPKNIGEYRKQVSQLDSFKNILDGLKAILGKIDCAIYMQI